MLIERYISDSSSVALWFLGLFLLFAFSFRYGNRRLQDIFIAFFSEKEFLKKIKEEYFLKNYTSAVMFVMTALAIVLNVYFATKENTSIVLLPLIAVAFASPWLKVFSAMVVSKIVSSHNTVLRPLYLLDMVMYLSLGVALVFALSLLLWISPAQHLNIVVGILVFFTVIRLVKSLRLAIKSKISLFYIILYFCTLEALPVLFIAKTVFAS